MGENEIYKKQTKQRIALVCVCVCVCVSLLVCREIVFAFHAQKERLINR